MEKSSFKALHRYYRTKLKPKIKRSEFGTDGYGRITHKGLIDSIKSLSGINVGAKNFQVITPEAQRMLLWLSVVDFLIEDNVQHLRGNINHKVGQMVSNKVLTGKWKLTQKDIDVFCAPKEYAGIRIGGNEDVRKYLFANKGE